MIGRRVGLYHILEKLGEGGMGEVYRAHDSALGRTVALKVLPQVFAQDAQRMARFKREAQLLASLNHTNIAQIYGLENTDGVKALVLELVEGETLQEKIARGPIPADEALRIAVQITEGLEAAHAKGILHRDLKPANIMITPDDQVKILDFGLAKAAEGDTRVSDLSPSPTLTAAATQAGVILGTAAYMSPEQARGKTVDQRTDVWAFGCVLYECLSGKPVFGAETVSETIAAILRGEPDWSVLPAEAGRMRPVLERCLRRDPKQRLRDIADVRIELEEAWKSPLPGEPAPAGHKPWPRSKVALVPAAILLVGITALYLGWWMRGSGQADSAPLARITLSISADNSLTPAGDVAISPDGQTLALIAGSSSRKELYLRRLDEWESRLVPGTEGARAPFFSPDGTWVAFSLGERLEKVPVGGGPTQLICTVTSFAQQGEGGSWGQDGSIILATWPNNGLWRVSSRGGTPEILFHPPEGTGVWYRTPERLPGSDAVLVTVWRDGQASIAALVPGESEPRTLVASGSRPRYLPTGHLLYLSEGYLLAVPFDVRRLETTGTAVIVIDDVRDVVLSTGYDVSTNGALVYVPGPSTDRRLTWRDRQGAPTALILNPRLYTLPNLSPDGRSLVVTVYEGTARNLWIGSIDREPLTRLTFGNDDWTGIWTPDGKQVAFGSGQGGRYNIFLMAADGNGNAERLTDSPNPQGPTSWSPKGDVLLYNEIDPVTKVNIGQLPADLKDPQPLVKTSFSEGDAVFSPDGRWIAFDSDESGRDEVYVLPYPGPGPKTQVSVAGGTGPVWNRNGRELFYDSGAAVMAVPVLDAWNFRVGPPVQLFELGRGMWWDVSPDGERFLMTEPVDESVPRLNLVQNWFEELRAKVPVE